MWGTPAWTFWVNGNLIGFIPSSVYHDVMTYGATYYQVGGEVYDSWSMGRHTTTEMGSGWQGSAAYDAAYHRNVPFMYIDENVYDAPLDFVNGTGVCGYEAASYYSLSSTAATGAANSGQWGTYFYYGG